MFRYLRTHIQTHCKHAAVFNVRQEPLHGVGGGKGDGHPGGGGGENPRSVDNLREDIGDHIHPSYSVDIEKNQSGNSFSAHK